MNYKNGVRNKTYKKHKLKHQNKTTKSRKSKTVGGVGAWSFGEHVYGNAENQNSVSGTSNTIETVSGSTYMANPDNYSDKVVTDGVVGGNRIKKGGRGVITEIAIPAVLLYANNTIGKKIEQNKNKNENKNKNKNKNKYKKKNKTKRVRFSRKIKN